jgi:hypothetical protein
VGQQQNGGSNTEIGKEDVFGATQDTVDEAAVSDGFWVMLRVSKGEHTPHVLAALYGVNNQPLGGFQQDYTYHLRVG